MDDTRGLLSAHEPSERERELCQAAVTAVTKAADSGHPSDREMATEQMRVLLRFLAGSSPLRPFLPEEADMALSVIALNCTQARRGAVFHREAATRGIG
ncbi:hypothetical protein ACFSKM_00480 [Ancylobacter dichloromethanicus]